MKTCGTGLNPHNRFQPIVTDRETDDAWYQDPDDALCPDSLATEVVDERVRTAAPVASRWGYSDGRADTRNRPDRNYSVR